MAMFWIQFVLVLGAVLIGIRRGGVALGMIGGLGVSLLVLGFRSAPSEPPIAVMLIILAVVTASATLQVAGGLDYLVQLTEKTMVTPEVLRAELDRIRSDGYAISNGEWILDASGIAAPIFDQTGEILAA